MAEKKKNNIIPFVLGFGVLLIGFFLPEMGGITHTGWRALSVLLFAIIFWATEAAPAACTAMAILILLPILGIRSYEATFSSLGTIMIWRLMAIFIITEAIKRVGLADRIAYRVIALMKGKVRRTLLCVLLLNFAFSFIIPNSYARTVLLVTIVISWLHTVGIESPSNIGKAFMIAIPVASTITASSIIVGASVDIFAADLFNTMVGYRWTYFNWLITNAPICLAMTFVIFFLTITVFKPETDELGNIEVIQEKIKTLGPLSQQEKFVICLFIGLMVLWFTDVSERIPAEMLVAFIMVFPSRLRIMRWKDAMSSVNWPIILLFGASISMAASLQSSGIVDWLGVNVFSRFGGLSVVLIAYLAVAVTVLVRLGMSNMTGAVATLLPLLITVAKGIGINPVWLGMICVMSSCVACFFPAQSANCLFSYGFGFYNNRDLLRFGLLLFPLFATVLVLFSLFYWPLVTLPI